MSRDLRAIYHVTDGRHEDLDFAGTVDGLDNAVQAVIHRIKTVAGELTDLGHPDYGSRHHELIGQPNTEGNRNLVKLYILQALAREPRVEKVLRADIVTAAQRDLVTIALTLRFVSGTQELAVDFSFGGGL
jgi:phage baseplate assembly protein W